MAGTRIVVAEDDADTRALLVRQLSRHGYTVSACADGREAFNALRSEEARLIVADWSMPVMDGVQLLAAVRELSELNALPFIYFILLTARKDKADVISGLNAGADAYLPKPYDVDELLARIRAGERIVELQEQLAAQRQHAVHLNAELTVLNARLERMARTDSLTDLPNRRSLLERLDLHWAESERYNRPLSCIMIDIDHFKRINDTYGHAAGDAVLQAVARNLQSAVRSVDLAARFGGEEFCIVCPETPLAGAANLAERIRMLIEEHRFGADEAIPVTASLGVASRRPAYASAEHLVSAADAMLYKAKGAGRNQVWLATATGTAEQFDLAAPDRESAQPAA